MDRPGTPITGVRWRPWRIPFREEFRNSRTRFTAREGIVIELRDEDGLTGIGEASPLTEYAGGSLDAVDGALSEAAARLLGASPASAVAKPRPSSIDAASTAALRCGLETACMDLGSRQTSASAAQWLAEAAGLSPPTAATELAVNGTLDVGTAEQVAVQACALASDGFSVLKIKVGGAANDDIERLIAVRTAVGIAVELRMDANGGWDVESARRVLTVAADLGVTLCEQPLSADDARVLTQTATLRSETDVKVALDESCRSLADVRAVISAGAADVIVVKPMISGLVEGARMLGAAADAGLTGIVTTSFDSSIGTAAAAHLAALLPAPRPACGLATASILAGDLVSQPMKIARGTLHLSHDSGLGVTLDETALESWATGPWNQA